MATDNRVGVWVDGKRVYPMVNIAGRTYTLPASTLDIDDQHFIVLSEFPPADFDVIAEIETLLEEGEPDDQPPASES